MTRYINKLHIITFIKIHAWAKTNSIENLCTHSTSCDRRTGLVEFILTFTSIPTVGVLTMKQCNMWIVNSSPALMRHACF